MKKDIKIKFVDFWPNFDYRSHMIYKALEKKYNVMI